jgi:hypothetical protein
MCAFRKEWVNCTEEEDQILKEAYLKCGEQAPTHQYVINNLKIRADFSEMTRTNLASERVFELKLVGGQLPFPPPGPAAKKVKRRGMRKSLAAEKAAETKAGDAKPEEGTVATLAKDFKPEELSADFIAQDTARFDFKPNTSGQFEFTLELEDRDDWGRIMIYKILECGIGYKYIDPRFLVVTDKKGRSTKRNREDMMDMLEVARSYPVKVTYNPPDFVNPLIWNHAAGIRQEWEVQCLLMSFIKWSITGQGAVQENEVKYYQHKCGFQRYQLYVHESHMWIDTMSEEEFYLRYPEIAPIIGLAVKVGPALRDVFRGKEEILNLLFGA